MASKKAKDAKALPLSDTLRDLALLRASDVDLAGLLPASVDSKTAGGDEGSLDASSEFIRETRKALRVHDRGDAQVQGEVLEEILAKYEDLLAGLQAVPRT
ncbi:hypothetical protein FA13DRAFT_1726655 [Coprinellus micaceus]|jgi:hypothetical protein|uniref:Uncharacterized protein n=1 Tax=Coprinellus micaceus TaxID=71717 RepID=A0A4Y7TV96_COPMI|nr:hypothetical protein FA13DRAFT_1726655 [Coprinellus micaceus]